MPLSEVILALDVPSREDALGVLDRIPELAWVKLGPVLLTRTGHGFVGELVDRGLEVFLDLKWHDIPNTVAGAVAAASAAGVSMATVHSLGGPEMLAAAAEASGSVSLVAVTVLTSHSEAEWATTMGRSETPLETEVIRLARLARSSGIDGIVCSPREIAAVRPAVGDDALIVTPGIRRSGDLAGDQVRTATPSQAASLGATHLVVGRPILQAEDPRAAFREIVEDSA